MTHPILSNAAAALCALSFAAAHADGLPTETFDGGTPSNAGIGPGSIPGTGLEVVVGIAYIANDASSPHGNFLDLTSGWYAPNFDTTLPGQGYTTVRSLAAFDLHAGYTYTLAFDYSRQTFSAGNGPFDTSLIATLGCHSVTYDDVAGFYYGFDWQSGGMTWTQAADELGAHVVFTALAPAGYSGMSIDNVSMVGLPPDPIVPSPVPEPETYALMLGGLATMGWIARRRRR